MPQPSNSDVYVSVPLTNILLSWMQSQDRFIADKVFAPVPVQLQSGKFWAFTQDYWYRVEARLRGPAAESAGSGFEVDSSGTYSADVLAVHKDLDDQTRANTMSPLDLDRSATQWVGQQLLLKRDTDWAANFFTTGIWTGATNATDQTGVASAPSTNQFLQWDVAGSTPIEDIQKQVIHMSEVTGMEPNVLVLSPYVFMRLSQHAEILDRIKYTQRGIVTSDLLAALFFPDGGGKVLVPKASSDTSKEGNATRSYSFIYGKSALLAYANPAPSIETPSAGYIFNWQGYLGGSASQAITKFRIQERKADRVEGEMAYGMKVIASQLGAFFTAAVS